MNLFANFHLITSTTCHRWEEAATSEGDHAQYNVQKEELRINPCEVDHSVNDRLQSGQDLEDFNTVLGTDIQRKSRQDINELEVDLERGKGSRDHVTYGECQKNQSADRGMTSVDGCGEFLSSGFNDLLTQLVRHVHMLGVSDVLCNTLVWW